MENQGYTFYPVMCKSFARMEHKMVSLSELYYSLQYTKSIYSLIASFIFIRFVNQLLFCFNQQTFPASTTPVTNYLPSSIVARFVRLLSTDFHFDISLRFDVIACEG